MLDALQTIAKYAGCGTGSRGMADRLGTLDGEIGVRSAEGQGITVIGRVPIGTIASRTKADAG